MGILSVIEQDAESALTAIEQYIDTTVWPEFKQFLTVFTPLEAKALLGDILGAVPVAETSGVDAAVSQVVPEIEQQSVANAETAAASLLEPKAQ